MGTILILTWELSIPGCRSLKEKRSVVRSLRDQLRHRFHASVAETGRQDVHDRAEITAALVTSDGRLADSTADAMDTFVASHGRGVILRHTRERV